MIVQRLKQFGITATNKIDAQKAFVVPKRKAKILPDDASQSSNHEKQHQPSIEPNPIRHECCRILTRGGRE